MIVFDARLAAHPAGYLWPYWIIFHFAVAGIMQDPID